MFKKFMTIAMMGALVLTACTENKTIDVQGEWNIATLNGKTIEAENKPYIGFNTAEGKIYGNSGCNYIHGTYNLSEKNIITLGPVASTMMSCPDMTVEKDVIAALEKVNKIEAVEETLVLSDAEGNQLMTLEKRFKVVAIAEIAARWNMVEVNGQAIPAEDLDEVPYMIFDAEAMSMAGFAGYNSIKGDIVTDPTVTGSIQFPVVASTKKMGYNMAFEDSVMKALEAVKSFGILADGHLAMFNANGQMVLELAKAE